MDVTKPAEVDSCVGAGARRRRAGWTSLVCNAGIARSEVAAEDVEDERWLNVLDVNLNGVFWCCRAFGRPMLAAGRGSIVTIGSMSGFIVNKPQRAILLQRVEGRGASSDEVACGRMGRRGVRVNSVAPTYVNTPLTAYAKTNRAMYETWMEMTPMGRMGEPDEIASVVLFLASDASSLMTGSIVMADGGYTCW